MRMSWGVGLLLLCACAPEAPPTQPRESERARIVVMAPAAAEMLEALDATAQVIGIGDFVKRPESIAGLPRVGAYNAPNVERVLELDTDLLITVAGKASATSHERLRSLGVQVLALDTSTFDGVFASLAEVGRAIGKSTEAQAIDRRIREDLESIETMAIGLPPRRVLFVVGRDPLYVAGPGSHPAEMIARVGGINLADDARGSYQQFSMEAVLERRPDVIIDTSDNRPGAIRGRQTGIWGRWEFLPATRDNRVYHVDPSRLAIPGMRLAEMTRTVGRLIQPEIFGEPTDIDWSPLSDEVPEAGGDEP